MSGAVLMDISGSVAWMTLSHPGKLNAMSRAMWRELRAVGELSAREMLLSAAVLDAAEMRQRGFLNQVVPAAGVSAAVLERVSRIQQLAPRAARLNKETFRALAPVLIAQSAIDLIATAYDYASSAEHREGVMAFIEKRPPQFDR